jgi:hypothetical protein
MDTSICKRISPHEAVLNASQLWKTLLRGMKGYQHVGLRSVPLFPESLPWPNIEGCAESDQASLVHQRRRRIPRCPFLPRTSGRPQGWVGQAAVGAPPHRTLLAGRFRPRSGSIYQSRNPCCARTPAAPPAQCAATVQAHDPPEHHLVPAYRIRYCYSRVFSKSGGDHPGFGAARCRIRSGR